jgi:hypothetical protein
VRWRQEAWVSPSGEPVPERLVRFVPGEWDGDLWESFEAWGNARRVWEETNGWPGGAAAQFGEWLEVCKTMPDADWDPDAV